MQKIFFSLLLGIANFCFAWSLSTGTYALSGQTADGTPYHREVIIKRQGTNYHVEWFSNGRSIQTGIGIFDPWESVLSIAFADPSNPKSWGVASYKVDWHGDLEGHWAFHDNYSSGTDRLAWKNSYTY